MISANQLRDRFEQILNDMIKQEVDDLFVQNLSRISRSASKVHEIDQMFRERGKFIIPIEN
ncbi:hypothetical protein D3C78_1609440 [compost metagenome]